MSSAHDFRIISLVPSLTDLCFALGIGHYVVGRTDYCISPAEEMPKIQSVGGPQTVDPIVFQSLNPTHILICPEENSPDILQLVKSCQATPIVVHPKHPEDNAAIFEIMGETFACQDQATELQKLLDRRLKAAHDFRQQTPKLSVLPLIWKDPWITVSPATYAGSMLHAVGLELPTLPSDDLYPRLDNLHHIGPQLDAIALTSEPYNFSESHCAEVAKLSGCPHVYTLSGEALAWYGSFAISALQILIDFKRKILDVTPNRPHIEVKHSI